MLRGSALALVLCVVATGSVGQSTKAAVARVECFEGRSLAGARACLQGMAADAAASLAGADRDFEAALLASGEDPAYVQAAREAQAVAAGSYSRYRQDKCNAAASVAGGANAQEALRLSCLYEADSERAAQVREAALLLRARTRPAPGSDK